MCVQAWKGDKRQENRLNVPQQQLILRPTNGSRCLKCGDTYGLSAEVLPAGGVLWMNAG